MEKVQENSVNTIGENKCDESETGTPTTVPSISTVSMPKFTPGSSGGSKRIIKKITYIDPEKIKQLGLEQKIAEAVNKLQAKTLASIQSKVSPNKFISPKNKSSDVSGKFNDFLYPKSSQKSKDHTTSSPTKELSNKSNFLSLSQHHSSASTHFKSLLSKKILEKRQQQQNNIHKLNAIENESSKDGQVEGNDKKSKQSTYKKLTTKDHNEKVTAKNSNLDQKSDPGNCSKIIKSIKNVKQKLSTKVDSKQKITKSRKLDKSSTEPKKKRGRPKKIQPTCESQVSSRSDPPSPPPLNESESTEVKAIEQLQNLNSKPYKEIPVIYEIFSDKEKYKENRESPQSSSSREEFCGFSVNELESDEARLNRLSKFLVNNNNRESNAVEVGDASKIPSFSNLRNYLQLKRVQNEGSENSCDSSDISKDKSCNKDISVEQQESTSGSEKQIPADMKKSYSRKSIPLSVLKVTKKASTSSINKAKNLKSKTGIDLFLSTTILKDNEVITEENEENIKKLVPSDGNHSGNLDKCVTPDIKKPRTVVLKVLNRDPKSGKVEIELIDPLIKVEKVQAVVTKSTKDISNLDEDSGNNVSNLDEEDSGNKSLDIENNKISDEYEGPLSPRDRSMSSSDDDDVIVTNNLNNSRQSLIALDSTSPKNVQAVVKKLSFSESSTSSKNVQAVGKKLSPIEPATSSKNVQVVGKKFSFSEPSTSKQSLSEKFSFHPDDNRKIGATGDSNIKRNDINVYSINRLYDQPKIESTPLETLDTSIEYVKSSNDFSSLNYLNSESKLKSTSTSLDQTRIPPITSSSHKPIILENIETIKIDQTRIPPLTSSSHKPIILENIETIEIGFNKNLENLEQEDAVDFLLSCNDQQLNKDECEESISSDCDSAVLEDFDCFLDNWKSTMRREVEQTIFDSEEQIFKNQENTNSSLSKQKHSSTETDVVGETNEINFNTDNDDKDEMESPDYELVKNSSDITNESGEIVTLGTVDHIDIRNNIDFIHDSKPIVIEHKILSDQEKINLQNLSREESRSWISATTQLPSTQNNSHLNQTLIMEEDLPPTQQEIELISDNSTMNTTEYPLNNFENINNQEVEIYSIDNREVFVMQDNSVTHNTQNECQMLGKVFRLNENNEIELIHDVELSKISIDGSRQERNAKKSHELIDLVQERKSDDERDFVDLVDNNSTNTDDLITELEEYSKSSIANAGECREKSNLLILKVEGNHGADHKKEESSNKKTARKKFKPIPKLRSNLKNKKTTLDVSNSSSSSKEISKNVTQNESTSINIKNKQEESDKIEGTPILTITDGVLIKTSESIESTALTVNDIKEEDLLNKTSRVQDKNLTAPIISTELRGKHRKASRHKSITIDHQVEESEKDDTLKSCNLEIIVKPHKNAQKNSRNHDEITENSMSTKEKVSTPLLCSSPTYGSDNTNISNIKQKIRRSRGNSLNKNLSEDKIDMIPEVTKEPMIEEEEESHLVNKNLVMPSSPPLVCRKSNQKSTPTKITSDSLENSKTERPNILNNDLCQDKLFEFTISANVCESTNRPESSDGSYSDHSKQKLHMISKSLKDPKFVNGKSDQKSTLETQPDRENISSKKVRKQRLNSTRSIDSPLSKLVEIEREDSNPNISGGLLNDHKDMQKTSNNKISSSSGVKKKTTTTTSKTDSPESDHEHISRRRVDTTSSDLNASKEKNNSIFECNKQDTIIDIKSISWKPSSSIKLNETGSDDDNKQIQSGYNKTDDVEKVQESICSPSQDKRNDDGSHPSTKNAIKSKVIEEEHIVKMGDDELKGDNKLQQKISKNFEKHHKKNKTTDEQMTKFSEKQHKSKRASMRPEENSEKSKDDHNSERLSKHASKKNESINRNCLSINKRKRGPRVKVDHFEDDSIIDLLPVASEKEKKKRKLFKMKDQTEKERDISNDDCKNSLTMENSPEKVQNDKKVSSAIHNIPIALEQSTVIPPPVATRKRGRPRKSDVANRKDSISTPSPTAKRPKIENEIKSTEIEDSSKKRGRAQKKSDVTKTPISKLPEIENVITVEETQVTRSGRRVKLTEKRLASDVFSDIKQKRKQIKIEKLSINRKSDTDTSSLQGKEDENEEGITSTVTDNLKNMVDIGKKVKDISEQRSKSVVFQSEQKQEYKSEDNEINPKKKIYKIIHAICSNSESEEDLPLAEMLKKKKNKNIKEGGPSEILKRKVVRPKKTPSATSDKSKKNKSSEDKKQIGEEEEEKDSICTYRNPKARTKKRKYDLEIKLHPRLLICRNREDMYKEIKEQSPVELASNEVQCGLCKEVVKNDDWKAHIESHYCIGWIEGETPIDVEDYRAVLNAMIYYMKRNKIKSIDCRFCNIPMKSASGVLYHIETCKASDEEREKMRYICICGKTLLSKQAFIPHKTVCRGNKENRKSEELSTPDLIDIGGISREKRKAVLKAEKILKETLDDDAEENEEDIVKAYFPKVTGATIKWKNELRKFGSGHCIALACDFQSTELTELRAHCKTCEKMLQQIFLCTRCTYRSIEKNDIFEHARERHSNKKERKDVEISEASGAEIDDHETSDSDISSGVDEDETNEKSKNKKPKQQRSRRRIPEIVPEKFKKLFINKWTDCITEAEIWNEEFKENNYSNHPLFRYAIPNVTTPLPTSVFYDYSPNSSYSMKFSYNCNEKFNKTFGSSKKPEIWNELEVFKSEVLFGDIITYIGGPVTSLAWIPIDNNQSSSIQYLALTYKKDFNQFVHQINPEKQKISMLIYEVGTYDCININKPLKILYGVPIESGPVFDIKFLPSGGYAPELNRLGLVAVATTEVNVNIYSLPLKAPNNCDRSYSFPLLELKPSFVLSLDLLRVNQKNFMLYEAQCISLAWSKFKGHNKIAGGFLNGCIAVWDISEDDDNLNCYEENSIRHFVPVNYFQVVNRRLSCVDFHYHTDGPRWIIASSENKDIKIFDLFNASPIAQVTDEIGRCNSNSLDWPIYWENPIISQSDELQNGVTGISSFSPHGIAYRYRKSTKSASGTISVSFNEWQNACIFGCMNGDICIFRCFEWRNEIYRKKSRDDKYLSYTDMIRLDDADILEKIQIGNNSEKNSIELFETDCRHKYGLIFSTLNKCQKVSKCDSSDKRDVDFHLQQYVKINRVASNSNKCGNEFFAAGYENGLVRIFLFNTKNKNIPTFSQSYDLKV